MYWKMSIDLSKPAVLSEGNLDPYDGYITYRMLQETSADDSILAKEIGDMKKMVEQKYALYRSDDTLDLGEALWIAHFYPTETWAQVLSQRSFQSLEKLYREGEFNADVRYRLAFREFGTTIGVQTNDLVGIEWKERVKLLNHFWSDKLYIRDRDITPVMYCTSLNPGVFWKDYPPMKK